MQREALSLLVLLGALCSCSEDTTDETEISDFSSTFDERRIDRVGRPLTNIVFVDALATVTGVAHEDVLDDFNRATPDEPTIFLRPIGGTLALLDAADGTCGNQIGRDSDPEDLPYSTLASLIADDRLYLSLTNRSCSDFWGLELNAMGSNGETCGGRTPGQDAVGVLYDEVLHLEDGLDAPEFSYEANLPFMPVVEEP